MKNKTSNEHCNAALLAILGNKVTDFEASLKLLRESKEDIDVSMASLLTTLSIKKNVLMLEKMIAVFPEIYSYKNTKNQNLAHIIAKENWKMAGNIIRNIPNFLMEQKDSNTLTPFHYACSKATGDLWNAYLEHPSIDVKVIDSNLFNFSPVYLATFSQNPEKVKSLLAKGAESNLPEKSGFTAIDLAVKNKDWDIVSQLINGVDLIQPKIVLEVVKDLPKSLDMLEGFISDENINKKLFPIPIENKETVWSFIFYYAPWSLIEKNMKFVKEYFIEDLKNDPSVGSVFYSILMGKRDSFKKIDWFLKQKNWLSLSGKIQNSVATFNKDVPEAYALHFSKLSNDEWKLFIDSNSSWLKNVSFADKHVFNIISLSKGFDLIYPNILEERWDKDENKKFNKSNFSESCAGEYLRDLVKSVPSSVVYKNFPYLSRLSHLSFLSVTNNDIYIPFAEKALSSENVLDYFQDLKSLNKNRDINIFDEHHFASAFMKELVKSTYKTLPNLDKIFDEIKNTTLFQQSYINVLNDEARGSSSLKMGNFNTSIDVNLYELPISSIIKLISKKPHQYSKERLNLLNLINEGNTRDFEINHNFFNSLNFKNSGINLPFVEKLLEIENEKLRYSLLAVTYMQGNDFITDVASKKLLDLLSDIPNELVSPIFKSLAKSEHHKNENIINLLKIGINKGFTLSSFWEDVDVKEVNFYIEVCSGVNDFSSFFNYFPVGEEVDCLGNNTVAPNDNFKKYLLSQAVQDLHLRYKDFQTQTAIFMMLNVFTFDSRNLTPEDVILLKDNIDKRFKEGANGFDSFQLDEINKILDIFEVKKINIDLKLDLMDNTNLKICNSKRFEKLRSIYLSEIISNSMNADNASNVINDIDVETQSFKI